MFNDNDFFGGMFDFDGDGHTDISEEYLAFQMMNDLEEEDDYSEDSE